MVVDTPNWCPAFSVEDNLVWQDDDHMGFNIALEEYNSDSRFGRPGRQHVG